MSDSPVTGLYVHVPFCAHKCEYCAFYSHAPSGEVVNRYVDALVRELTLVAQDLRPRTGACWGEAPDEPLLSPQTQRFGANSANFREAKPKPRRGEIS